MTGKRNKFTVIMAFSIIALVGLAITVDWIKSGGETVDCGAGDIRRRIDLRDFQTKYFAYAIEINTSIKKTVVIAGKLEPQQLQAMSEALQQANEFRKYLVAGYNSCAITKAQFGDFEKRFQAIDGLARQINILLVKPSLEREEQVALRSLVMEYAKEAGRLATK